MTTSASTTQISRYIAEPLRLGEPDVAGPLAVFPVFGPAPTQEYISFADGRERGVAIKEVGAAGSVRDLVIENAANLSLLLYEGEEVLGAQQNRTFDVTVLVAAGATLKVPVSCVEAGRWDQSRHDEEFHPAPQAAYPELRRAKARHAREQLAAGLEARANQAEVWREIDAMSIRHGARSDTGAMHDLYEARRDRLHELTKAVRLHDGQSGALVAIGGRFAVLDYVSRRDVFARLQGPLGQGYALDALDASDAAAPSIEDAAGFIALVSGTPPSERDGIGLGREIRFAADGVAGSGLVSSDELVQLTAFPEDGSSQTDAGTRIRRPSRRRT